MSYRLLLSYVIPICDRTLFATAKAIGVNSIVG